MKKSRYIAALLCLLHCVVCLAQTDVAKALYDKGDFDKAAQEYLSVAKSQGTSASLYFNLANCYAQSGDLGSAVLYYSRAARLDPSNKEIKNNLNYFASKVEDSNRAELRGKKISVAPDPETFFVTAHRIIAVDVSSNFWAVLAASSFILLLGCVAVYLFCSNILLRKTGFFGGFALLCLSVLFLVFSFMSASAFDSHDEAVLMAYKTKLLIEPSSDAKPAANQICQGTRLQILAEETAVDGSPSWYKVRLNSDIEGWIKADAIEII
ncbi:MAG: tetratricopeptide repeat protein [Muribaculum sp.]|nr:tetratricopeptide repeat protein [Muribaculum sp.]